MQANGGKPIERSDNESLIVGLNLLRLLVQNRIAEFHTELETTEGETLRMRAYRRF